jgi:hypothetical protein
LIFFADCCTLQIRKSFYVDPNRFLRMAFSLFGVLIVTFVVFLAIAGLARITLGD